MNKVVIDKERGIIFYNIDHKMPPDKFETHVNDVRQGFKNVVGESYRIIFMSNTELEVI